MENPGLDGSGNRTIAEPLYEQYLSNLIAGRRSSCADTVKKLMDESVSVKEIYTGLFQRSMYRVGELWEFNKISVATEHLATAITEGLMATVYPSIFRAEHKDRTAVVSCGVNEFHQIGGRMVADVFEMHGWHGYFLGANTPTEDLLRMIDEKHPDLVALSLSVYYNIDPFTKMLEAVADAFPEQRLILGGHAFRWGGEDLPARFPSVEIVLNIGELEKHIGRAK